MCDGYKKQSAPDTDREAAYNYLAYMGLDVT